AEWPRRIARHAEGGDAPRDGDDQHAADDSCQHVGEPEPEAAEDEPDDVEQSPHLSRFAPAARCGNRAVPGPIPRSLTRARQMRRTRADQTRRTWPPPPACHWP